MAAYNLGMLTAGLPDVTQRHASQQVQGNDYYQEQHNNWLSDWQKKWDAAPPVFISNTTGAGGADISPLLNLPGAANGLAGGMSELASYATQTYQAAREGDPQAIAYLNYQGLAVPSAMQSGGHFDNSVRLGLEKQKASQQATFASDEATRLKNQQSMQSAYDQSNGSGFNGGIINGSYGTPFGGAVAAPAQVDGVNTPNMPQNQPWGQAGYGGPTGGTSQGGFGGGWGQNAQGAQPQGWGGPFTNKNPWGAS